MCSRSHFSSTTAKVHTCSAYCFLLAQTCPCQMLWQNMQNLPRSLCSVNLSQHIARMLQCLHLVSCYSQIQMCSLLCHDLQASILCHTLQCCQSYVHILSSLLLLVTVRLRTWSAMLSSMATTPVQTALPVWVASSVTVVSVLLTWLTVSSPVSLFRTRWRTALMRIPTTTGTTSARLAV